MKKTKNTRLRAYLFNTTVLPALTYASETWALRKQEENAVSVIERAIENDARTIPFHASEGRDSKISPTSAIEDQRRRRVCQGK